MEVLKKDENGLVLGKMWGEVVLDEKDPREEFASLSKGLLDLLDNRFHHKLDDLQLNRSVDPRVRLE
jgi:hypothetical protein